MAGVPGIDLGYGEDKVQGGLPYTPSSFVLQEAWFSSAV